MKDNKCYITMLGTGNAAVTKCYNTCFLLSEKENFFLVDAGGGNQILSILEKQNVKLSQIHDLFITHAHSDHILGVIWIVRMIGQQMNKGVYSGNLRIYACKEVISDLRKLCDIVLMQKITKLFEERIELIPVQDGDTYRILDQDVTFFDIQSSKLIQYGFEIKEKGFLFCGDEPLKQELSDKMKNCRYLLHEAFCLYSERDTFKPYEKHHSTVKDVCSMAEKNGVENLILMHTEDSHILKRKMLYTQEGKEVFSGNLFVPDDGERICLK